MGDDFFQGRAKNIPDHILGKIWDEIIEVMDPVRDKEKQSVLSFMETFRSDIVRSCDLAAWGPINDPERASEVLYSMSRKGIISQTRTRPFSYALNWRRMK